MRLRDMAGLGRALVLTAVVAGQRTAAAEPCHVEIVASPDEVREQIEAWVGAEPSCTKRLEVTVTACDDGYALYARDDDGRVRERVVPDAETAAVLVVAWMADDAPAQPPMALAVPSTSESKDEDAPTRPTEAHSGHDDDGPQRWLALGVLAGPTGGLRGQLDLVARGRWILGVAGELRRNDDDARMSSDTGSGAAGARLIAATRRSVFGVALRAHLGVGVDAAHAPATDSDAHDGKLVAKVEAGLFVTMHVAGRWAFVGGPLADHAIGERGRGNVALFLGVGRGP
jgi:hypothetical protein